MLSLIKNVKLWKDMASQGVQAVCSKRGEK